MGGGQGLLNWGFLRRPPPPPQGHSVPGSVSHPAMGLFPLVNPLPTHYPRPCSSCPPTLSSCLQRSRPCPPPTALLRPCSPPPGPSPASNLTPPGGSFYTQHCPCPSRPWHPRHPRREPQPPAVPGRIWALLASCQKQGPGCGISLIRMLLLLRAQTCLQESLLSQSSSPAVWHRVLFSLE